MSALYRSRATAHEHSHPKLNKPLIIGHRGASHVAPENTIAAFERALDDGADGVEFDVRLARDGAPVVIHDATLRRTGLREDSISNLTSDELQQVSVGRWFNLCYPKRARAEYAKERVPTLEHVLRIIAPRCHALYLEMKCEESNAIEALARGVVAHIRACEVAEKVIVESFALEAIAEVKRIAPDIRTAALFERKLTRPLPAPRAIIAQARESCADELALHRSLVSRRIIEAARACEFPIVVWTIDSAAWVERAVNNNLHAIITNVPARLRARLNEVSGDTRAHAQPNARS